MSKFLDANHRRKMLNASRPAISSDHHVLSDDEVAQINKKVENGEFWADVFTTRLDDDSTVILRYYAVNGHGMPTGEPLIVALQFTD